MQFPRVYSDVVDIEEESGGEACFIRRVRAINSAESRSYEA